MKLTTSQRSAVACFCLRGGQYDAGWTLDPELGEWVCSACRKPSPMAVFRICMWCGDEFVLLRKSPRWRPLMTVLSNGRCVKNEFGCTTCEPDE